MGFELKIGDRPYLVEGFSVQEASSPLSASDSSGQVGTISFTVSAPDKNLVPDHPINVLGPNTLIGKPVRLSDSRKGFTVGTVSSIDRSLTSPVIQVTALSRLGKLNVYGVQAGPFIGTLKEVFEYYASLAGETTDVWVDPSIANTQVTLPGWNGELWFHMKQLAMAYDCDISLVSGVILLRPTRQRTATRGRDVERSFSVGGGSLAQTVEIVQYNHREVSGELIYPPGGWSEEVTVFNVNAGETIKEVIELEASVTLVEQPVMQTFVAAEYNSSSVFTVVGDDGYPITPAQWDASGGSLFVEVNPDTVSLTLHVTAPTNIFNRDGSPIGVYSISLSSDTTTSRYSTLRIVGHGVAHSKETIKMSTGVPASETGTEVGIAVDNIFLSNSEQVSRAGGWAAREFSGSAMTITGTVTSVNRRGDSGEATFQTYEEVRGLFPGGTYATVQTSWSGQTYQQVFDSINDGSDSLFENQVFGNVNGARVWDETSKRWYRIREADIGPDVISFTADDDLVHSDIIDFRAGQTYQDLQTMFSGMTYREVDLIGLRNV